MGTSPDRAKPTPLPAPLARERAAVLHRALEGIPLDLLEPLLAGLRRHADCLSPGHLAAGDGGCAVGMMLRELAVDPGRQASVYDSLPELSKAYPRLPHLEIIYDATCEEAEGSTTMDPEEIPRAVGLWMAAETQAEITVRHLEGIAATAVPGRVAPLDRELFEDTVARLRELRPGLSAEDAASVVESVIGARRGESEPLFMPSGWDEEVRLQEERLQQSRLA